MELYTKASHRLLVPFPVLPIKYQLALPQSVDKEMDTSYICLEADQPQSAYFSPGQNRTRNYLVFPKD